MTRAPQPYRPATTLLSLGEGYFDPVTAADFPETRLRFRNDAAAATVGLAGLDDATWIRRFGRFEPLPGSLPQPLALRYHGHQFRSYNPELGDGRGFTFAQLRDDRGRLMDLGTKGSGTTQWSRSGDGRLTLKGAVREVLATEMLEALGVETSRTLSVIETGEALHRGDEPSPTRSAVLVRLGHGHIRIGSFQRLAYERDEARLRTLTDYVLRELYGEQQRVEHAPHVQGLPGGQSDPLLGDEPAVQLLTNVVARTARLAASYMAAAFVHGVLNTDNINVTGESFDYGPWRFAPLWDPAFTAAYFDETGLYAFGRQPEAIHWNAMQLAIALRPICEAEPLIAALDGFAPAYQAAIGERMAWRLGIVPRGAQDGRALVQGIEQALRASGAGLDRFFFDAFGGTLPEAYGAAWDDVRTRLAGYVPRKDRSHPYWSGEPCSMLIDEVEAIWAPIAAADDWSAFETKLAQVRAMGSALS